MNPATLDGHTVRARALGADRTADGDWMLDEQEVPLVVTQLGVLTVNYVEALDYTQFVVNGIPVQPDSIQPVTLAGQLHTA